METTPRPQANYTVISWLGLLHGGALLAPFFFEWQAVLVALGLYWLAGSLGVCLGYHRLLTHGSFRTFRPIRWLFAFLGGLAGLGSAVDWVAHHRQHHAHADQPGDPHSPQDGAWWAHMIWLGWISKGAQHEAHVRRWTPDLLADPVVRWLGHLFVPVHILSGVILFLVGYRIGGTEMAVSFLVWGLFVRLVIVVHSAWLVNSAAHMWGYRNYETRDNSRNNWWVALVAFGEGWHNNHHAHPRAASHGHRWWELDPTFAIIRLLQMVGLAWDVVDFKRGSPGDAQLRTQTRKSTASISSKLAAPSPVRVTALHRKMRTRTRRSDSARRGSPRSRGLGQDGR